VSVDLLGILKKKDILGVPQWIKVSETLIYIYDETKRNIV
jgi:hypothetical protein